MPPANPAVEPEFSRLLGARADLHVTRFPVRPGCSLAERLDAYNDALPEMIRSFGGLRLDALVMACSGSRYLLGPAEDRRNCAELSAEFGLPVASATEAIRRALEHLGADEVTLVSPYQPWLTASAERFWTTAGIRIAQVVAVQAGTHFAPYEVTTDQLVAQIEQAAVSRDAVLLLTGTGMRTLRAIDLLTEGNEWVVLTSNLCGVWWALTSAGLRAGLGRVEQVAI
ncbi:maleate cis-trans isomerase family protein [Nocardia anaemiae]|uniref:maleate cis-trans isomerase family protein n=1 Tax=Nocardia anaemiae TaxID=263910 RepID=UPI0035307993